jgi:hypothetical protein
MSWAERAIPKQVSDRRMDSGHMLDPMREFWRLEKYFRTIQERFAVAGTHEERRDLLVISREIISDAHRVIEKFRASGN